jgi:hypothetical protein
LGLARERYPIVKEKTKTKLHIAGKPISGLKGIAIIKQNG